MQKILTVAILVCLLAPSVLAEEEHVQAEPQPLYLMKKGRLVGKGLWHKLVGGKKYWLYKTKTGGEMLVYEEIPDVPDLRPYRERHIVAAIDQSGGLILPWIVVAWIVIKGLRN